MSLCARAASHWEREGSSSDVGIASLFAFFDMVVHNSGHVESGLGVCWDLVTLPFTNLGTLWRS